MIKKTLIFLLLFMIYADLSAWHARGHMLVAAIAWDNLDKSSQKSITEILKSHPEFSRRWESEYDDHQNDVSLGKFLMMQASVWPDQIKTRNHPDNQYSRTHWHYITYEMRKTTGDSGTIMTNTNLEPNKRGDVLTAIERARWMISIPSTPTEEKAVFLSWLIHLIGDIHQPLHCATLFNETDLLNGDNGGNQIYIRPNSVGVKLHSFWDGLPGSSDNIRTTANEAKVIVRKNPKSGFDQVEVNNPRAWSNESLNFAVMSVHLNGQLIVTTDKENASKPPEDYTKNAKRTALQLVALAGYRLSLDIDNLVNL